MKHFLKVATFLALLFVTPPSFAATCFWVGGAATWSTINLTSWASGTGGTPGTCAATGGVPKQAADTPTFDGSSGGGTVIVDSTINGVTLTSIVSSAFTGTLDFATNNPSLTLSTGWTDAASGVHTISLGSGTYTFTNVGGTPLAWTTSANLTLNAGTSTILFSAVSTAARTINLASKTWNNVTVTNAAASSFLIDLSGAGSFTIANLTLTNVLSVRAPVATWTISGTLAYSGSVSNQGLLFTTNGTSTLSVAGATTLNWLAIQNITKAGAGSIGCTNCFDGGGNTGITFTPPSGGGGRIIGG